MRVRRGAALVAAVAAVGACVAVVSGAGAAIHPGVQAGAAKFDLSTRAGVVRYLGSLGLDSHGFVIQRGHRNYAGPSCPGKGWTCSRSTRVVQVTTGPGTVNRYEYSTTAAAASPCGSVQSGPSNNAKAIITSPTSPSPQSCTIMQNATGSGGNFAQLSETIPSSGLASQTASQDAQVTQTSDTGSNNVQITQQVTQSITDNTATSVTESQVSDQTFSVKQTSNFGTQDSKVTQSLSQTESNSSATGGSQYQRANLIGHVDQLSAGVSTSQNNQTESQAETAMANSSVRQTQIGPTRCCTSQGTNTRDTFKVVQKMTQTNTPNLANQSYTEDAQIDLATTGSATGQQTTTQNGFTTTNSSTGSTVNLGTTCTQGTCTPAQTGFPSGDVFVSVGDGKVQEWNVSGSPTLVRTLDTLKGTGIFTTGLAFDPAGNLYVTDFNANDVSKFNGGGTVASSFGSGYNADPESIVFDKNGNAYVGQAFGSRAVLKFSPSGVPAGSFTPAREVVGTDWIDLAPDQCTLYYTSEGFSVKRFDVCANTQLTNFATLPATAFAVKLLPGGGALVADSSSIQRLDASGGFVQQYGSPAAGLWFSLALDPGGTSFWAGDEQSGDVKQFDLASGAVLASFNTGLAPPADRADGLAVAP